MSTTITATEGVGLFSTNMVTRAPNSINDLFHGCHIYHTVRTAIYFRDIHLCTVTGSSNKGIHHAQLNTRIELSIFFAKCVKTDHQRE